MCSLRFLGQNASEGNCTPLAKISTILSLKKKKILLIVLCTAVIQTQFQHIVVIFLSFLVNSTFTIIFSFLFEFVYILLKWKGHIIPHHLRFYQDLSHLEQYSAKIMKNFKFFWNSEASRTCFGNYWRLKKEILKLLWGIFRSILYLYVLKLTKD